MSALVLLGWMCAPVSAGTDAVSLEDIGQTSDQVRNSPEDENTILNGDEAMADKVFIYLDGCPLVQVDGPTKVGDGAGLMVVNRKNRKRDCVTPSSASAPSTENMKLLGSSIQGGLHVRIWREDNDVKDDLPERRLAQPNDQTIIVDITTIHETDPVSAGLKRPDDPRVARRKKVPAFTIPDIVGGGGENRVHLAGLNLFGGGGSSSGSSVGGTSSGGETGRSGSDPDNPTGSENYPGLGTKRGDDTRPRMYPSDPSGNLPRVPIPAGISLLAGGLAALGGFAAMKRRSRKR